MAHQNDCRTNNKIGRCYVNSQICGSLHILSLPAKGKEVTGEHIEKQNQKIDTHKDLIDSDKGTLFFILIDE